MEGTQEIEKMTSEKQRGRMDDATAQRRSNRSDAAAWMTRPREMEKHERRGGVDDASAWQSRNANDASA